MDGTLLNSKGEVSNLFFTLFHKLKQHKVHFCAASGRQHNSIVHKLYPIKDEIFVIAENGGITKKSEKVLLSNYLAAEKVINLIPVLRKIQDVNMVLCCEGMAFIESTDKRFISLFQEYYQSFKQVDDLIKIAKTTPVFKIAVYHFDSSEKYIFPEINNFSDAIFIKISGKNWLDISDKKANKGNALREVQKKLQISKTETLVFGDYHNDIEMLQEADFSFAMKNAHKDIKEIANYTTESNDNNGVEIVLQKLLLDKATSLISADQ